MTPTELRERRIQLRMTQLELAAALGVTRNTVARWERGELVMARPEMIDALVTRHTYTLLVPDTATGFGTNGTMTGAGQPVLPPEV